MKSIFVTGGSRGLGREIVLRFIEAGWGVAFTYSSNKKSATETIELAQSIDPKCRIKSYQLNLIDADTIEPICEEVIQDFETISAVVNNAALVNDAPAALMSYEAWKTVIDVNLTGSFLVSQGFLLHFIGNRDGRFIHLSSLSARGSSGQINYAASKAGLEGLSLTLAKEYGRKGITSNIVTVGYVPTAMTEHNMSEQNREYWIKHCPAGRIGKGREVSSTVYFLCQDDASFISGENIYISGAFTYAP